MVKRETDETELDKFYDILRTFDKSFLMSDDNNAFIKGENDLLKLKMTAHELCMAPEDFFERTGHKL